MRKEGRVKKGIFIALICLGSILGWWLAQENIEFFEAIGVVKRSREDGPARSIDKGKIAIGMETWQVKDVWGPPEKRNVETLAQGMKKEQWIYGNKSLYFTNGILTSWQEGQRTAKTKEP
jgi:hypothetical protein